MNNKLAYDFLDYGVFDNVDDFNELIEAEEKKGYLVKPISVIEYGKSLKIYYTITIVEK